jgi:hypothetical protein
LQAEATQAVKNHILKQRVKLLKLSA